MSYLFSGSVEVTADDKNRFRFPAKYKEAYSVEDPSQVAEVYVLKTLNSKYLTLLPKSVGNQFIAQLNSMSTLHDSDQSRKANFYLQNLELCKVDTQGRFIVPSKQAALIGLKKDAVITGAGAKLRIWSKDEFIANEKAEAAALEATFANPEANRTALDDLVFGVD